ncbi:LysR substrate-binding domain-containing protein [Halobacteriovorax sp. GB3]|uniref:LysR substrate-binding domain-containing protein n=1 Tax=Halobacteriovorax sp. GB3 TaxID=2719615 RepID=UPI002362CDCD|nr:LysR substrate-binding domain-containing protein [Halobacteriovorax sp. GB3]MDD0854860.1 LysR substrate-binding domain-containing protein [Halobacteriovorax sp. GB3]
MTITQLEYVLAVDKFRHFGKASKACHVTQPTLSMQLQKLEDELGIIIFDRSKSPTLPTMEGAKLIEQARIVLREFNKISDIIQDDGESITGDFKLAVIPTLAPYLLPLFLEPFTRKYPDLNLKIEEAKTEDIIQMLDKDEIDGGLLVTPLHEDRLIERVLFYEPFYVFASKENDLYKKKKVKESDLNLDEIWLLNEGNCLRTQVLNLCSREKEGLGKEKNIHFESGNLETLKNIVSSGDGFTLLPELATRNLNSNEIKMLRKFSGNTPSREVSLVHGRSFLKERIINALVDEIIHSLPDEVRSLKSNKLEIVEIFQR